MFNQVVVYGASKGSYTEGTEGPGGYNQPQERGHSRSQFKDIEFPNRRHAEERAENRNDEWHR